jgi:hypothetical protein
VASSRQCKATSAADEVELGGRRPEPKLAPPRPDPPAPPAGNLEAAVRAWLPVFYEADDDVLECRFLGFGDSKNTHIGWLRKKDIPKVAFRIASLARGAEAAYVTPHILRPSVLNGAKIGEFPWPKVAKRAPVTDADVAARRFLILDVDPVRPTGQSATDAEKAVAWAVLERARERVRPLGWGEPLVIDSGNGYHAYVRFPRPVPAQTPGEPDPVRLLLELIAADCDTDAAKVDPVVANPSRVVKLPGSWARKGDNTPDRPHRQSRVVETPADWQTPRPVPDGDFLAEALARLDPDGSKRANLAASRRASTAVGPPINWTTLPSEEKRVKRATAYVNKLPPGIQGQRGNDDTYRAASALVHGFAIAPEVAVGILMAEFNNRCVPPWSEPELAKMCNAAADKRHERPRGYLAVEGSDSPAPPPSASAGSKDENDEQNTNVLNEDAADPFRIGRAIVAQSFTDLAGVTLAYWLGDFYAWRREAAQWSRRGTDGLRAEVASLTRGHFETIQQANLKAVAAGKLDREDLPRLGKVTRNLVADVIQALQADTILHEAATPTAPAWIRGRSGPDPAEIVATRNALVHLPTMGVTEPTPDYFNLNVCGFAYESAAPAPVEWLKFLDSVWGKDVESIALLQEWMGYLLTPDKELQKMLLLLGPPSMMDPKNWTTG